ncbi:MAG: T9SS type A sorting domain-containing protein [Ignavibacteria bacterium]
MVSVYDLKVHPTANYLVAGTAGQYHGSDLTGVVGINENGINTADIQTGSNYPNPFNPVTNLGFGISELGFVSLKVYDIEGKEVVTLVNENKTAGYYNVQFDGSKLSSGVYFYRLETKGFVQTKRMMLIK